MQEVLEAALAGLSQKWSQRVCAALSLNSKCSSNTSSNIYRHYDESSNVEAREDMRTEVRYVQLMQLEDEALQQMADQLLLILRFCSHRYS